jgi:hypothetical protein
MNLEVAGSSPAEITNSFCQIEDFVLKIWLLGFFLSLAGCVTVDAERYLQRDLPNKTSMGFKLDGTSLTMSGSVRGPECQMLKTIFRERPIKTIILKDSRGGRASTGYCVGEFIREKNIETIISGYCNSSCSRMWLGGVKRSLYDGARVGLHGHYDKGKLLAYAPKKLESWIPKMAPEVNKELLAKWARLPTNKDQYYFYNDVLEICLNDACKYDFNWNVRSAGLSNKD